MTGYIDGNENIQNFVDRIVAAATEAQANYGHGVDEDKETQLYAYLEEVAQNLENSEFFTSAPAAAPAQEFPQREHLRSVKE